MFRITVSGTLKDAFLRTRSTVVTPRRLFWGKSKTKPAVEKQKQPPKEVEENEKENEKEKQEKDNTPRDTRKVMKSNHKEGDPSNIALRLKACTKRFPTGRVLFENLSLVFFHGAKIGILGQNGSGKSTLLKILGGVDKDHEGELVVGKNLEIGYLPQEPVLDPTKTVEQNVQEGLVEHRKLLQDYEMICEKFADPNLTDEQQGILLSKQSELWEEIEILNCSNLDHKIKTAMNALRCPPGDWPVTNLSGGEKRRVALCRLLLSHPSILLLDEPTNHLDTDSVAWLEDFLEEYKGLVICITHDRYFLDNVAAFIIEVEHGKVIPFKGNYVDWLEKKSQRIVQEAKHDKAEAKLYEKELTWIRSGAKGQRSKSKARIAQFEEMTDKKEAKLANKKIEGGALVLPEGPRLGKEVIELINVSKKFDNVSVFDKLSLKLGEGQILGIVGPNGSGKSTLFRLITGELKPEEGTVQIGKTVILGYNAQTREALDPDALLWKEICGTGEEIEITPGQTIPARSYVAQFNFPGAVQTKRIGQLSGGERNRVMLAKSLKKGCNVLLLDEPTNDLDVDTLRKLEEALISFKERGAAIVISHDRWFLERVATDILSFEEDGTVRLFRGTWQDFTREKSKRKGRDYVPTVHKLQKFKLKQ